VGCVEDKIVQILTARILEAIYEPRFSRHSYGFRHGRSAHHALKRLYEAISQRHKTCVVVEVDIEKFFNNIDHEWLLKKLSERIADRRFLRHIRRLMRNAVLHSDGRLAETERGTPQGSPVSPILANICLNEVVDEWFRKISAGRGEMVRYADDIVFVFSDEETARNIIPVLNLRLNEAGLKLNLEKTRVIPFSSTKPKGTVKFLGFELYWGRNGRKQKTLKLKTAPERLHRSMQSFKEWIKLYRNRLKLTKLWDMAASKLRGHYEYFGVVFNQGKLQHYYWVCTQALFKWLNRRSQKRSMTWEKFLRRLEFNPLPRPPLGFELKDITGLPGFGRKHIPKSRMRESRTSGSVRSGRQKPLPFT
jgi:RNA-directed DNA polymerase